MGTSSLTLRKLGTINLTFGPAPFQFNATQSLLGPRFFTMDGTGGFFGLAGYYAAVPTWSTSPFARLVRAKGFSVNPLGIFDMDMTGGTGPYSDQATTFNSNPTLGMAQNNPQIFGTTALGLEGLYTCYGGPGGGLGAQFYGPLTKSILPAFPPLSFESQSTPFSVKQLTVPSWYNGAGTGGYAGLIQRPATVLIDGLLGEVVIGCQPSGLFAPSTAPCDGYIGSPSTSDIFYTLINTLLGPRAVYTMGNSSGGGNFKINPFNGNAVATWSGQFGDNSSAFFLYCFNVFCDYTGTGQAGSTTVTLPVVQQVHFSDPADEAIMWTGQLSTLEYGWVYQLPGGGFFVAPNTSPNAAMVIQPDFSGYYRVNIQGASLPQMGATYSQDTFGIDLNGNAYILNYNSNGSAYINMVSTLNEGATLILVDPPLVTAAGVNCRSFNQCNLSFEG